jgi:hypothetical protein
VKSYGADQEYVAAQAGHDDVTTTTRIDRYVFHRRQRGEIGRRRQVATRESVADVGRRGTRPGERERAELSLGTTHGSREAPVQRCRRAALN